MVHDTKWWYVIPIAPGSKVMQNTFTNMEHMEDASCRNEDDVKHANEDVDDQEIREEHDNEDEHAISHDPENDPTIGDDGDVDVDDQGIGTIINGQIDSELNLFIALQIDQMDIEFDGLAGMDLIEDEIEF